MSNPLFTPDQEHQIRRFMEIINETGGFGAIKIEVVNGVIKFITLGEVSAKMSAEKEVAPR